MEGDGNGMPGSSYNNYTRKTIFEVTLTKAVGAREQTDQGSWSFNYITISTFGLPERITIPVLQQISKVE